jgi:hypothetical protein
MGRLNVAVGLDICGEDVAELGLCCVIAASPLSVLDTGGGTSAGSGTGSSGDTGIPTDSLDGGRGDRSTAPEPAATSCNEENVGLSVDAADAADADEMRCCPAPELLRLLDGIPN